LGGYVCFRYKTLVNRVGQNHIYIWCVYGIYGREFTKYTVIYGAFIRYWPTLLVNTKEYSRLCRL